MLANHCTQHLVYARTPTIAQTQVCQVTPPKRPKPIYATTTSNPCCSFNSNISQSNIESQEQNCTQNCKKPSIYTIDYIIGDLPAKRNLDKDPLSAETVTVKDQNATNVTEDPVTTENIMEVPEDTVTTRNVEDSAAVTNISIECTATKSIDKFSVEKYDEGLIATIDVTARNVSTDENSEQPSSDSKTALLNNSTFASVCIVQESVAVKKSTNDKVTIEKALKVPEKEDITLKSILKVPNHIKSLKTKPAIETIKENPKVAVKDDNIILKNILKVPNHIKSVDIKPNKINLQETNEDIKNKSLLLPKKGKITNIKIYNLTDKCIEVMHAKAPISELSVDQQRHSPQLPITTSPSYPVQTQLSSETAKTVEEFAEIGCTQPNPYEPPFMNNNYICPINYPSQGSNTTDCFVRNTTFLNLHDETKITNGLDTPFIKNNKTPNMEIKYVIEDTINTNNALTNSSKSCNDALSKPLLNECPRNKINKNCSMTVLNVPTWKSQGPPPVKRHKLSKIDLSTLKRKLKRKKRPYKIKQKKVLYNNNLPYKIDTIYGVPVYGQSDSSSSSSMSSSDSDDRFPDPWIKSGPPLKTNLTERKVEFMGYFGLTTHNNKNSIELGKMVRRSKHHGYEIILDSSSDDEDEEIDIKPLDLPVPSYSPSILNYFPGFKRKCNFLEILGLKTVPDEHRLEMETVWMKIVEERSKRNCETPVTKYSIEAHKSLKNEITPILNGSIGIAMNKINNFIVEKSNQKCVISNKFIQNGSMNKYKSACTDTAANKNKIIKDKPKRVNSAAAVKNKILKNGPFHPNGFLKNHPIDNLKTRTVKTAGTENFVQGPFNGNGKSMTTSLDAGVNKNLMVEERLKRKNQTLMTCNIEVPKVIRNDTSCKPNDLVSKNTIYNKYASLKEPTASFNAAPKAVFIDTITTNNVVSKISAENVIPGEQNSIVNIQNQEGRYQNYIPIVMVVDSRPDNSVPPVGDKLITDCNPTTVSGDSTVGVNPTVGSNLTVSSDIVSEKTDEMPNKEVSAVKERTNWPGIHEIMGAAYQQYSKHLETEFDKLKKCSEELQDEITGQQRELKYLEWKRRELHSLAFRSDKENKRLQKSLNTLKSIVNAFR